MTECIDAAVGGYFRQQSPRPCTLCGKIFYTMSYRLWTGDWDVWNVHPDPDDQAECEKLQKFTDAVAKGARP